MKTMIHILAASLLMNFNLLFADNSFIIVLKVNAKPERYPIAYAELARLAPKEAVLNYTDPLPSPEIINLVPVTPDEATFDEVSFETLCPIDLEKVAPETPKEAEFEDDAVEPISGMELFAPTAPAMASFEE